MIINLTLLIILSVSFPIICEEKEECVAQKLKECSLKHKISSQFYPSSQKDLEHYCSAIKHHEECTKDGWTQCIDAKKEREYIFKKLNQFSSFHYKDICNLTTTYSRLFVKYGKCLNQTFSETTDCQIKYKVMILPKDDLLTAVGYSKNNSRIENIQKIRQICCWWSEYQSCTVKTVLDRCGEQAAVLINEQFYKTHTKSPTSRVLTYKSCLPQDKSFRFPACFLNKSVDPKSLGITMNVSELSIEDFGRRKDIQMAIEMNANYTDIPDVGPIEASVYDNNISIINKPAFSQTVSLSLFLILIYW